MAVPTVDFVQYLRYILLFWYYQSLYKEPEPRETGFGFPLEGNCFYIDQGFNPPQSIGGIVHCKRCRRFSRPIRRKRQDDG